MKMRKRYRPFLLALCLCLSLAACGGPEDDLASPEETAKGNTLVTDMEFLDGMWSVDGLSMLYFDSGNGWYIYHSAYGPTGYGEFTDETGKPIINYAGFLYDFYLREDGVLLSNQNGSGGSDTPSIDHHTFRRDDAAELTVWTLGDLDGSWQNAAGETIVIDAAAGEYTAQAPRYSAEGTARDEWQGMGPYLYDNGSRAYLCPAPDGGSFTISSGVAGCYSEDGHFDGVFYRIDGADVSAGVSTDVWSDELYKHDACQFEGVWYPDGDLAAETYIRIDDTGRWSYYRRAPGAEPVETDYGTFSYSVDETSIYYADSALHDGVSYRVFELDDDALVWDDEGTYYWME